MLTTTAWANSNQSNNHAITSNYFIVGIEIEIENMGIQILKSMDFPKN